MDSIKSEGARWCTNAALIQCVERLSVEVAAGEFSGLERIFTERSLTPPVIQLDPHPNALPSAQHRLLLEYWRAKRSVNGLMPRNKLDPIDLHTLLGNLMLLEASPDGFDFIYRVYGTKIAEHAQKDWTGLTIGRMCELVDSRVGVFYRAIYAASALIHRPIFTEHSAPPSIGASAWQRLIVPLSDAAGNARFFLATNYPVRFHAVDKELNSAYVARLGAS